jgi:hypothetical protein
MPKKTVRCCTCRNEVDPKSATVSECHNCNLVYCKKCAHIWVIWDFAMENLIMLPEPATPDMVASSAQLARDMLLLGPDDAIPNEATFCCKCMDEIRSKGQKWRAQWLGSDEWSDDEGEATQPPAKKAKVAKTPHPVRKQ